jgi:hypothetical protein
MSHEAERTAVEQLFLKVTLPIIVQDKGRFGIVGTATLFTIQDRPFLVTAGHTILDYSVDRWAYSEHPTGGPICTLGALLIELSASLGLGNGRHASQVGWGELQGCGSLRIASGKMAWNEDR